MSRNVARIALVTLAVFALLAVVSVSTVALSARPTADAVQYGHTGDVAAVWADSAVSPDTTVCTESPVFPGRYVSAYTSHGYCTFGAPLDAPSDGYPHR